jgi:hypothetical protein
MDPNPRPDRAFQEYQVRAPLEHAETLELFKSVIESGQTAIKSLIAINGGAAVALLAFLGNMLTKPQPTGTGQASTSGPSIQSQLATAMAWFVFGVFLIGAVSAVRYLNAWAHLIGRSRQSRGWVRAADAFNYLAIVLGLASLAVFLVGGWKSYNALR